MWFSGDASNMCNSSLSVHLSLTYHASRGIMTVKMSLGFRGVKAVKYTDENQNDLFIVFK